MTRPSARQPRFGIGQKFMSAGKHPREMTVIDIWRTFNSAGELVRLRYVAECTIMGQKVKQYDVVETSIALRLARRAALEGPAHDTAVTTDNQFQVR